MESKINKLTCTTMLALTLISAINGHYYFTALFFLVGLLSLSSVTSK